METLLQGALAYALCGETNEVKVFCFCLIAKASAVMRIGRRRLIRMYVEGPLSRAFLYSVRMLSFARRVAGVQHFWSRY